ncbi:MAG TPA: HD domain-containing phosphohydrolase, partial [Polyangiaceae bacterium]
TLTGSIRLLSEVLSLMAPAVFERSQRLRGYVMHMANRLEVPQAWRFELASALSMLGCVGLPEQTLERVFAGRALSPEERRAFDEHPKAAHRLLAGIPRFGEVAEMIRLQNETPLPADTPESIRLGASFLRLAREVDHAVETGTPLAAALAALKARAQGPDKALLETLENYRTPEMGMAVRTVRVGQMTAHMILDEDVKTSSGVVVLPKGREITSVVLERLLNFSAQGSLVEPIRVRVPG